VRVLKLRRSAAEAPAAARAGGGCGCCSARPTTRVAHLERPMCVHAELELQEGAQAEMPRSTVEIASDGHARAMGCQHAAAALPSTAGIDSANSAHFSYRLDPLPSTTLQQDARGGRSLTLSFVLQVRDGRKVLGRAELDVGALRSGDVRQPRTFSGWLEIVSPKAETQAPPVAELLVEVEWSCYSSSSSSSSSSSTAPPTAVQILGGDSQEAISKRFSLLQRLGSGSFATVWRAVPLPRTGGAGGEVAIKLVDKAECMRAGDQQAAIQLIREQALLCELKHPRLTCCSEIVDGGTTAAYVLTLGGPRTLLSVMERSAEPMDEAVAVIILEDVASALEYLHGCNVVHRDIKPDNILLSPATDQQQRGGGGGGGGGGRKQRYRALLADLGFATRLEPAAAAAAAPAAASGTPRGLAATQGSALAEGEPPQAWMAHSLIGSGQYLAPEVILTMTWDTYTSAFKPSSPAAAAAAGGGGGGGGGYNYLVDVWSLGVVLYKALTRRDPHPDGVKFKTLHEWARRGAPLLYPPDEWTGLSEHAVQACRSMMLVPDPKGRATAAAVCKAAAVWAAAAAQ
jgi:serine/threonine protein kinase